MLLFIQISRILARTIFDLGLYGKLCSLLCSELVQVIVAFGKSMGECSVHKHTCCVNMPCGMKATAYAQAVWHPSPFCSSHWGMIL